MTPNVETKVKILLVDDRPANLDVLEQILTSSRYELHCASSGEEALKYLLDHEYACCLLDIRMPVIDGFQTAEFIRKDKQLEHLPIIFVTAEAGDQKSVFQGYEKGAVDFLIKPIEPLVLRSKVSIFADLYCQRKALERTKEIEELNVKLEKLNAELVSVNADLEHFAHMAAHDLREPVRKQGNLITLLRDELPKPLPDRVQSLADEIERASGQMAGMINDFRALVRLDYIDIKRTPLDFSRLIDECVGSFRDLVKERKVKIARDPFPQEVSGYESLVRRLYENLLKNVFDHVHTSGFEVRFTAEKDGDHWVFGVKNTGSSIPQKNLRDIFKMFRKFDPQAQDGSGIGLTICKKIVDRHQGLLNVESDENSVHFKFTLERYENSKTH